MEIKNDNVDLTPTINLALLCEILYQITNVIWYRRGVWFFGVILILTLIVVFLMAVLERR